MATLTQNIADLALHSGALPFPIQRAASEVLTAAETAGHHVPAVSWFNPASTPEHHVPGFPGQGGVAVDLMVYGDTTVQDWIDEYLWANRDRLGVCWIISRGRIRSTSPGKSGQWEKYSGKDPHTSHTHINFGRLAGQSGEGPVPTVAYKPPAPPAPVWDGKSYPGSGAFVLGQTHPAVTVLGQRLVAHGWAGYTDGPGPRFGPADLAAVQWFQQRQGWTGADADGYPGPTTWALLMADPPPPPPVTHEAFQLNCQWPGFASTRTHALTWSTRVKVLAAAVPAAASVIVAQELGRIEAADLFSRLGQRWRYARAQGDQGNGLNVIGWDDDQWEQMAEPEEWSLPSWGQMARTMIAVKLRHRTDGMRIRPASTHLAAPASDLSAADAVRARTDQAKRVRSKINDDDPDWPTLLGWDGNDRTDTGPNSPKALLRAYGWRFDVDQVTVANLKADPKGGIDAAATNYGARILAERVVPLGSGSDHAARAVTFTAPK